jgi:hypothetical protein
MSEFVNIFDTQLAGSGGMSEQDDELALQRQMVELQVKMEAKQREKAENNKANRLETMLELVVDRLDKLDKRLERIEDVSREKLAATDQIIECVGSIEQTAQGLEGRMANVERRIEASEVKSVEALKMTGAEMQERLDGVVTNLEAQLSKATQGLLEVGSGLVSATQSSLEHAVERLQRETVSTVNRVDENVKGIARQTTGLRKIIQQDLVTTGRTIHQHVAKELQQHKAGQGAYSLAQLKKEGADCGVLRRSGHTAKQLKEVGYSAQQLQEGGYPVSDVGGLFGLKGGQALHDVGYPASALTAYQLHTEQWSPCTDILLEGQQQGDHQHSKMGMYELMEGKEVNGRGVWQMAGGGKDVFLYFFAEKGGHWFIGDRGDMEAGRNRAWFVCKSSALTPSALAQGWYVVPGEAKGSCTERAPNIKSRLGNRNRKYWSCCRCNKQSSKYCKGK